MIELYFVKFLEWTEAVMFRVLHNESILIFGGLGALGSCLSAHFKALGFQVISAGRAELSGSPSLEDLAVFIERTNPRLIINCASMIGLDRCFLNRMEAMNSNAHLPSKITHVAERRGLPLIHFSTDNVFLGDDKNVLPVEGTTTCPTTWYGATKLLGEISVSRYEKSLILRMPMLFGPTNSEQLVSKLVRQAMSGSDVYAASDIYNTPTYTPNICKWVCDLVTEKFEVKDSLVHLSSDRLVSVYDCLFDILRLFNLQTRLFAVKSDFFSSKELKPQSGGLNSNKVALFSYEDSIERYAQTLLINKG